MFLPSAPSTTVRTFLLRYFFAANKKTAPKSLKVTSLPVHITTSEKKDEKFKSD